MAKLLIFVSLALDILAFEFNGAQARVDLFAPFGKLSKVHPLSLKEEEFHRQLRFIQPKIFSKLTKNMPMEVREQPIMDKVLIRALFKIHHLVLISLISRGRGETTRKLREYLTLRKI